MNIVDSCGWLEYFADAPNASFFESVLMDSEQLLVPRISIYEVCRRLLHLKLPQQAEHAMTLMTKGKVVDLSPAQLLDASASAIRFQLAMADAIIWQTAQVHGAALYTQDADLKGLPLVKFKAKKLVASKPQAEK
jgi:predicted nucleic acid-binding protein